MSKVAAKFSAEGRDLNMHELSTRCVRAARFFNSSSWGVLNGETESAGTPLWSTASACFLCPGHQLPQTVLGDRRQTSLPCVNETTCLRGRGSAGSRALIPFAFGRKQGLVWGRSFYTTRSGNESWLVSWRHPRSWYSSMSCPPLFLSPIPSPQPLSSLPLFSGSLCISLPQIYIQFLSSKKKK